MQLHLDNHSHIPANYPAVWFRVESWSTGRYVADFTSHPEAAAFAISHAKEFGCRYDHKVSTMRRTAA